MSTEENKDLVRRFIVRITNGRIAENWINLDALGMLQQLGVIPAMG